MTTHNIRTETRRLLYPSLFEPARIKTPESTLEMYGAYVSEADLTAAGVELDGFRGRMFAGHEGGWVFARARSKPRFELVPGQRTYDQRIMLEDAWLREHQLATTLHRPIQLVDITLIVERCELSERARYLTSQTHALRLDKILVHQV